MYEDEKCIYIVMELIEGYNMFELLNECRKFEEETSKILFYSLVKLVK